MVRFKGRFVKSHVELCLRLGILQEFVPYLFAKRKKISRESAMGFIDMLCPKIEATMTARSAPL